MSRTNIEIDDGRRCAESWSGGGFRRSARQSTAHFAGLDITPITKDEVLAMSG